MRKILIALAATGLMAAAAQPALADDPGAIQSVRYGTNDEVHTCTTPQRTGVLNQYGAWGYYVDGCTTKAYCPDWARWCKVTTEGFISVANGNGQYVSLNSRARRRWSNNLIRDWQDGSCTGWNSCGVTLTTSIKGYDSATEQCNGVRQALPNTASVRCTLSIQFMYTTPPADA
jgi:hypothetical protein